MMLHRVVWSRRRAVPIVLARAGLLALCSSVAISTGCVTPSSPTGAAFELTSTEYSPPGRVVLSNPGSITFGNTLLGSPYDGATLILASTGRTSLAIRQISVSDAAQFPFADTCHPPSEFVPGTRCWISVGFNPTRLGRVTGTLTVATNAGDAVVNLGGNGTAKPLCEAFGGGFNAMPRVLNTGSEPVTIIGASVTTPLELTGATTGSYGRGCGSVPFTLAPDSSCFLYARCVQPAPRNGTFSATITATSSCPGQAPLQYDFNWCPE